MKRRQAMNSRAFGATAFVDTRSTPSTETSQHGGWRGLLARLGDAMGLHTRGLLPAEPPAERTGAPEPVIIDEKFFAREVEAEAYANHFISLGYQTKVEQNAYDYIWSVEVYAADGSISDGGQSA
jgi:hypothetical protein